MTSHDPFSAQDDLNQLRRRGRALIEAKEAQEQAEKDAHQRGLADDERKFAELRTWSTWRSISLWGHVWFFGLTFAFVKSRPFPLLGYEASMQHHAGRGRGGP